ncbi:MAG: DUF262 domain-containing protein [Flavobacterium sp.]|uniref:DUF262 domain-containing protein n=1 Tax=Flavobacterium sp. TaxID=239 RepID=UPI0022BB8C97|nr:DUF262 domain-containing protein [Flavobacterium sp.]MCZ8023868.1 DUF262 domain-containing protein [Cytophagales bacterium]MCZ8332586.1 DUF262 domain-containing protein [Flavobacterium sp.]
MDNRVYYGQYSLRHWIELIIKENITLPAYQRHFVWKEEDVKKLITALKSKQFVPPITIGYFKEVDRSKNLILDGQQRLTSILLAYIGCFPNEKKYKIKRENIERFADENDIESETESEEEIILDWTLKALIAKGKNKNDILEQLNELEYKKIDFNINERFLNETFLGFSYIIPNVKDEKQQQKFYTTVFRNINNEGKPLVSEESRASLYFLDKDLVGYFNPEFCKKLTVKTGGKADFVRYISLLSQYKKDGNTNHLAKGFASKAKMESYYEKYIFSITGENGTEIFVDFLSIFPNKEFKEKFLLLEKTIDKLDFPEYQFTTIIELDVFLFGVIYFVLIENTQIDFNKKVGLKKEFEDACEVFKNDKAHSKAPSALKYLKERIDVSIEIVRKYAS